MKASTAILAGALAGFAFTSAPDPAAADPKHCPPGHAMKGECKMGRGFDRDDYRDRRGVEEELDRAYREGYREGRRDAAFDIGEQLARDRYRVLDRDLYYDRYGQRLDDRYYYAEADGRRLLIEAATGMIVDLLTR